jgi:hypothetical protein
MRLNKKAIDEFKEIYFREFGQQITDEEAQELVSKLISLVKILCHQTPVHTDPDFSGEIIRY